MNKVESSLNHARPVKKNLERYIESHKKKGEKFWDRLIDEEIESIKELYAGLIEYCKGKPEKIGVRDKDELDEAIKELEEERNEFSSYKKHRNRAITRDNLENIRMEEPPDEIIEGLKKEIKKRTKIYQKNRSVKDLRELASFKKGLIDLYIILKKAEDIF